MSQNAKTMLETKGFMSQNTKTMLDETMVFIYGNTKESA
jgi:hypothetical protein